MRNRAGIGNLVVSLVAFLVFMIAVLSIGGGGMGQVEVAIWLVLAAAGVILLVRRFLLARATRRSASEVSRPL